MTYRSRDAKAFKPRINEMIVANGCAGSSISLCNSLALHSLLVRDAKMLEAVLDVCPQQLQWPFHRDYVHKYMWWGEHAIVRVVEKSEFESYVPIRDGMMSIRWIISPETSVRVLVGI